MSFTSEEIEAVVDGLVRSSVRTPAGVLGERDLLTTQADYLETLAALYLVGGLDALLWTERLGLDRLASSLSSLQADLNKATGLVSTLSRTLDPDVPTESLVEMQAALTELSTTLSSRTSGHATTALTTVPAFARTLAAAKSFLEGPAQNVRFAGAIVDTPQTARKDLVALLLSIESSYLSIQEEFALLSAGPSSLAGANLSGRSGATAIRSAKSLITETLGGIGGTPSERFENLRGAVLNVLAAKAVLSGFSVQPTTYTSERSYTGTLRAYSDTTHPATPPSLAGTVAGPYAVGSHTIGLLVNGTPVPLELLASYRASMESSVEPFSIHLASPGIPDNTSLTIVVDGVDWVVLLAVNPSKTAQQVADDINLILYGITDVVARAEGPSGSQRVVVERTSFVPGATLAVKAGSAQETLGFLPDYSWESRPTGAKELAREITATQSLLQASTRMIVTDTSEVRTDPKRTPLVRARNAGDVAVTGPTTLTLTDLTATFTLGCSPGDILRLLSGVDTGTEWTVTAVTATTISAEGTTTPTAATAVTYVISTDRSAASYYLLAREKRLVGTITRVGTRQLRFTPTSGTLVGCTALRVISGLNEGTLWTSPTPTPTYVEATGTLEPLDDTEVEVELVSAPTLSSGGFVELLGSVNQGSYEVESVDTGTLADPGTINLRFPLSRSSLDDGPIPIETTANFGGLTVDLTTRSTSTTASLAVTGGSGVSLLYTTTPQPSYAETTWLSTPDTAPLVVGDRVRHYTTSYSSPSGSYWVESVEEGIVGIDPPIRGDTTLDLSATAVPFARVEHDGMLSFLELCEAFSSESGLLAENYFLELQRLAHIVLQNTTPPLFAIQDLQNHLATLEGLLDTLQSIVSEFSPPRYVEVEGALDSLRARGLDRLADLLLSCRFSEVFSMELSRASYSSELMTQIREVTRAELPVSATERPDRKGPVLLSQADSEDFEYNRSDIDTTTPPDIT